MSTASPNTSAPVPVGVIGCGRMGRLHARVYSQIPGATLVGVHDPDPDAAARTAAEFGGRAFDSLPELLAAARAVTIAAPTSQHHDLATAALGAGVDCLIEKPLARTVAECRDIADIAARLGRVVQVGHVERFNPAVRAMARLGVRPAFIEVTRVSPLTFRSIDVGVVLDMMIHDIDIVLSLAQSPVESVEATGVSVLSAGPADQPPAEDVANARIRFRSGCVANLTASRLALKTERRLRIFSAEAYISIDYQKRYGIVARRSGNVEALRSAVARIRAGEIEDLSQLDYSDLVSVEELQIDDVEPLRAELESFLDAVRTRSAPAVSAADGLAAVELADRIVRAMPALTLG